MNVPKKILFEAEISHAPIARTVTKRKAPEEKTQATLVKEKPNKKLQFQFIPNSFP